MRAAPSSSSVAARARRVRAGTGGPAAPIAPAQLAPGPALDASAARQAVVDFVEAYAASPDQGIGPSRAGASGPELASWVRVARRAASRVRRDDPSPRRDVRDVEFVGSLDGPARAPRAVGLSASVALPVRATRRRPVERVRVLDGPVTLIRRRGHVQGHDLLRNGVPMSDGIELFRDEERTAAASSVRLDSLFMFPPNWQFNVVVREPRPPRRRRSTPTAPRCSSTAATGSNASRA